jgi:hypothetical protein
MVFLRSDQEVALNDLLVALRESVDHYNDAIELVDPSPLTPLLREAAIQRSQFIPRLEDAIRQLGDLPSVPDPDKESGEMLIHHVGAALSNDYEPDVIEQRIASDQQLAQLVNDARKNTSEASFTQLMEDIATHITQTLVHLKAMQSA